MLRTLHAGLRWQKLRTILFINTLIAVLLYFVGFHVATGGQYKFFVVYWIFSQAVGGAIYLIGCSAQIERVTAPWLRVLGHLGIFLVGGWVGSAVGYGVSHVLFGFRLSPPEIRSFWLGMTFLAIFFGAVVSSYFALRDKLQKTAAILAEKEVNEQRLQRLKTKAELEALYAKVNPHFLFNTLNSIASLIPIDPQGAEAMVQKLAHLFRYTLDVSQVETIKLCEELQIITEYLEIEKVRLGDRLSYNLHIADDLSLTEIRIPGLVLQPLVENSVKHGIAPTKTGGHIDIKCSCDGESCLIEICDTGNGFSAMALGDGFGLSSVRERLALYYENRHHFAIQTRDGVRIQIRLPLKPVGGEKA